MSNWKRVNHEIMAGRRIRATAAALLWLMLLLAFALALLAALTGCSPMPADTTSAPAQKSPYVLRITATAADTATATPAAECVVSAEVLNVRSGPGAGYLAVAWLYAGDTVTITEQVDGWMYVSAGWIYSGYVRCK